MLDKSPHQDYHDGKSEMWKTFSLVYLENVELRWREKQIAIIFILISLRVIRPWNLPSTIRTD